MLCVDLHWCCTSVPDCENDGGENYERNFNAKEEEWIPKRENFIKTRRSCTFITHYCVHYQVVTLCNCYKKKKLLRDETAFTVFNVVVALLVNSF